MSETTILIKKKTRDRLLVLARKNQTYDDFLNELMDLYENQNQIQEQAS